MSSLTMGVQRLLILVPEVQAVLENECPDSFTGTLLKESCLGRLALSLCAALGVSLVARTDFGPRLGGRDTLAPCFESFED